jgi:hypothetical protein
LDAVFDPQTNQNRDLSDEVRVDLASTVDPAYPTTELFNVTADSNSITSTTDRRRLGPTAVVDQLTAQDTIIDPAGVSHTGELADSDNPITDFNVGGVSDGEFLQNIGGTLTGSIGNTSAKGELNSRQSISQSTLTDIDIDTVAIEQDAAVIEVDAVNNQLLLKQTGIYTVTADLQFVDAVETSLFEFRVNKNGVTVTEHVTSPNVVNVQLGASISALIEVTSTPAALTFEVFHGDNGGSRDIGTGTSLAVTREN